MNVDRQGPLYIQSVSSLDTLPFSCPLLTGSMQFVPKWPCLRPYGSESLQGDSFPSFTQFFFPLTSLSLRYRIFFSVHHFYVSSPPKLFKLSLFRFHLFPPWLALSFLPFFFLCWTFLLFTYHPVCRGTSLVSICRHSDGESFHLPPHHPSQEIRLQRHGWGLLHRVTQCNVATGN